MNQDITDQPEQTGKATPEALAIIGAGRDHAELIDEVMELVMQERQRRNTGLPLDLGLLETQPEVEPLDAQTLAALDEARAQAARGEVYTLEEARQHLKQRVEARRAAKAKQGD